MGVDVPLSLDVSFDRSRTPERVAEPGAFLRGVWAGPEEGGPEHTVSAGTSTGVAKASLAAPAA
eukprot:3101439-Lingulodinium_polyedra.AAC.1